MATWAQYFVAHCCRNSLRVQGKAEMSWCQWGETVPQCIAELLIPILVIEILMDFKAD
jgi:hypothetical protein